MAASILNRLASISQRTHYPQLCRAKTKVGFGGEATPSSFLSRLSLYRLSSSLDVTPGKASGYKWLGNQGHGKGENSLGVRSSSTWSSCYHPRASQSKLLSDQTMATKSLVHLMSSSSIANTGKGFIDMRTCHTIEEAAEESFRVLNDLNPRNLVSFWSRVCQLVDSKRQTTQPNRTPDEYQLALHLNAVFVKTLAEMRRFSPKDLAQTAKDFAAISACGAEGGAARRRPRRGQRYSQGTPQQILHEILVGEQLQHQKVAFESIANVSVHSISKFDAQSLSNLAYANAIVGLVPILEDGTTLFDRIADKCIPLLRDFEPQALSNLVWSFDKVAASNPVLFEKVAEEISERHVGKFKPRHLSDILLAYTKLAESNQRLFKRIGDHLVTLENLKGFDSQACSNLLWVLAKTGEAHPRLFTTVAEYIISLDSLYSFNAHDNLHRFDSQTLANTLEAFATAEVSHPRLFTRLADHIVSNANLYSFTSQSLSIMPWAFAKSGESHPKLFETIADHIVALDDLNSFDAQDCSRILWAYASAGIFHRQLFDKIFLAVTCDIQTDTSISKPMMKNP